MTRTMEHFVHHVNQSKLIDIDTKHGKEPWLDEDII